MTELLAKRSLHTQSTLSSNNTYVQKYRLQARSRRYVTMIAQNYRYATHPDIAVQTRTRTERGPRLRHGQDGRGAHRVLTLLGGASSSFYLVDFAPSTLSGVGILSIMLALWLLLLTMSGY